MDKYIKKRMSELGITQAEVANFINENNLMKNKMSRPLLCNMLNGKTSYTFESIEAISRALDIGVDEWAYNSESVNKVIDRERLLYRLGYRKRDGKYYEQF